MAVVNFGQHDSGGRKAKIGNGRWLIGGNGLWFFGKLQQSWSDESWDWLKSPPVNIAKKRTWVSLGLLFNKNNPVKNPEFFHPTFFAGDCELILLYDSLVWLRRPDIIDYTTQLTGDAWSCDNVFDAERFSTVSTVSGFDVSRGVSVDVPPKGSLKGFPRNPLKGSLCLLPPPKTWDVEDGVCFFCWKKS